jgi:phosphoribosylglycinamide formyltransferase-1
MLRIGALISGSGTNLTAIIDACEDRRIDGTVVWVGADNPNAAGLQKARNRGIETTVVDYRSIIKSIGSRPRQTKAPADFALAEAMARQRLFPPGTKPETVERFLISRAVAEARLLAEIQRYSVDLLVLAGFMRTLSPYFIDRFNTDPETPRIMNIHPALLPAFPGVDGYGDTFRYGCKVAGCTVHFVDYGEDTGPIIGQRAFAIDEGDTLDSVREKGLRLEWALYPVCVQYFAENRLVVEAVDHGSPGGEAIRRRRVLVLPAKAARDR